MVSRPLRTIRSTRENADGTSYTFEIRGVPPPGWQDLYHLLLNMNGWALLGAVAGVYLAINLLFAIAYRMIGGVANCPPDSLVDDFFFSVQTMGTIGYGTMYPVSHAANAVVVAESLVSTLVTAVTTGLVFVRFSLTRPRLAWSRRIAIAPLDGVPTLMIRIGNERGNNIRDAQLRLMMTRTNRSSEGVVSYRTIDLPLLRDRAPALNRAWNVLHPIVPGSPLHGETPTSLAAAEVEISLSLVGTDETSLQPVHGQTTWDNSGIVWGYRLADIVSEPAPDTFAVDLSRFHDVVPAEPIEGFPYPGRAA